MPFLPLHDINPRILIAQPWVTWGAIAACVLVYVIQVTGSPQDMERLVYGLGVIPATLTGEAELVPELYMVPAWATLITSTFLHGGFMHLVGNMLYLWVFGDNVEDSMGHGRFIVFYLVCGIVAGLAQTAADPGSVIPTIGASGAVSGILGAYLLLHPKAKVLIPIYIIPLYLPAWVLLVVWFGFQGLSVAMTDASGGGVAWWAHIGGFIAGAILIVPFRYKTIPLLDMNNKPSGIRMTSDYRWGKTRAGREDGGKRKGPWT